MGRRRDAIDQLKLLLSTIVEAGGTGVVSPHAFGLFSTKLPPFTPPRSDAESRRLLVEEALRGAGEHAVSVGAVVYLEPLNPYEDFVVNTLADAASIIDEGHSAGVQVIADAFHMSVEESDIGAAIRQTGSRIGHVQLGGSNRLEPGADHYDWPETLAALETIGYDGWLAGHGVRPVGAGRGGAAESSRPPDPPPEALSEVRRQRRPRPAP